MSETNVTPQPVKILLPKVDVIFKLLFGDERNKPILIDFLKSVLDLADDEYESITLVDPHLKRETIDDKLGIVDVRLTTKNKKIIHVEMQVIEDEDMPERVTYYNAKMLAAQLKSGHDYDKVHKTITIVVADFELVENPTHPNKYHHQFMFNDKDTSVNFTDITEIHTLELRKIPEQNDNTKKYDWLQFLKAEREEEFDMLAERSATIKEAVGELKRLSQDEEAQRLYDARQKALWAEHSRLRTAINKRDREIATNFINMGLTNEQISEGTGIPVLDVEKLRTK